MPEDSSCEWPPWASGRPPTARACACCPSALEPTQNVIVISGFYNPLFETRRGVSPFSHCTTCGDLLRFSSNPNCPALSIDRGSLSADSPSSYPKSQTLLRYRRIGDNAKELPFSDECHKLSFPRIKRRIQNGKKLSPAASL